MKRVSEHLPEDLARRGWLLQLLVVLFPLFLILIANSSFVSAAPCPRTEAKQNIWVARSVDNLVRTAQIAYHKEYARRKHDRVVKGIASTIGRCQLSKDREFAGRYPEFLEYVRVLLLSTRPDRELGFEVPDQTYFAETSKYTGIPDFLLTNTFLRSVSSFETLPRAKALLRELNAGRAPTEQLVFFSYVSRHLGTPDNPDSFLRLLIVVPGNEAQQIPEKWVQFGIPDPRKPKSVRNVSVVSVVPRLDQTTSVYFKDYYRTYGRNGAINIKGRWELDEGDDPCVECHKSGVLPIFPEAGSVTHDEQPLVEAVNERFLSYGPARFDKYLVAEKFGPGLGSIRPGKLANDKFDTTSCPACHNAKGLGPINWPMDSKLISSFVKSGLMPQDRHLAASQRAPFYRQLIQDYFAIDEERPGVLKAWLLGKLR